MEQLHHLWWHANRQLIENYEKVLEYLVVLYVAVSDEKTIPVYFSYLSMMLKFL